MPVAPPEWATAVAAPGGVWWLGVGGGATAGGAVATAELGAAAALAAAGPGRAVSHADASDPAQLRKRGRSARAADRTCEEAPFASASSVAKRETARASASTWEIARYRAAIRRALPSGLRPAYSAAPSGLSARPFTVGHAS